MILIIDPDASKVIDAVRSTGVVITRPMMEYAHYIISNMKAIGTWQLSNAVYGFVGGTADSHKFNWKDLRDVDGAFRLTFINTGDIIHSSNGVSFGGTNGYADSNLLPSLNLNNTTGVNLMAYVKSSVSNEVGDYMICAEQSYGGEAALALANRKLGSSSLKQFISTTSTGVNSVLNVNNSNLFLGCVSGNQLTNINTYWNNGIKQSGTFFTGLASASYPARSVLLMGNRVGGVLQSTFDGKLLSCVTVGAGLTDTQIIQRDQIVTNAQNILNRA